MDVTPVDMTPVDVAPLAWERDELLLPRRGLAPSVLLVFLVVGLMLTGFAVYLLVTAARRGAPETILGPLMVLSMGGVLLSLPATLKRARTRIAVEGDILVCRDRLMMFTITRRTPVGGLRGFDVEMGTVTATNRRTRPIKSLASLRAIHEQGDPFYLAIGYPAATLHEAASLLRQRLGSRLVGGSRELTITQTLAGAMDAVLAGGTDALPDQPAQSDVRVEEHELGVAYHFPARGLFRGSRGMFFFALLWNGIMVLFLCIMVSSVITSQSDPPPLAVWGIMLAFLAVGVGMAVASVHMGQRRTVIDVTAPPQSPGEVSLFIVMKSPLKQRTVELKPGEVAWVRVADSGLEVNDRPVRHLKIGLTREAKRLRGRRGGDLGLLVEREEQELQWLAAHLRHRLKVGSGAWHG